MSVTLRGPKRHTEAQALAVVPLLKAGMHGADIAKQLGVSERTVKRWVQRPEVRAALDRVADGVVESTKAQMTALVSKSLRRLGQLVDSEDEAIALEAVDSVLDRCEYPRRKEVTGADGAPSVALQVNIIDTAERVEAFKRRKGGENG